MKETVDSRFINRNELNKACFRHDMAYGDFGNLARRTSSDNVLRNNEFNIAKNPNMTDIKEVSLIWFTRFLIKIFSRSGVNEIKQNEQLAEELHKPITRKF